jgi:hypothetical protein
MAATYELYIPENEGTERSESSSSYLLEVYGYPKRLKHISKSISFEYQKILSERIAQALTLTLFSLAKEQSELETLALMPIAAASPHSTRAGAFSAISSTITKLPPLDKSSSKRALTQHLITITRLIYITSIITGLAIVLTVLFPHFSSVIVTCTGIATMGAITLVEIFALSEIHKGK